MSSFTTYTDNVNEKSVLHSETICGCNEPQQTKIICYNNKTKRGKKALNWLDREGNNNNKKKNRAEQTYTIL